MFKTLLYIICIKKFNINFTYYFKTCKVKQCLHILCRILAWTPFTHYLPTYPSIYILPTFSPSYLNSTSKLCITYLSSNIKCHQFGLKNSDFI